MQDPIYQSIRNVYNKLGNDYLEKSKDLDPIERPRFRNQFQPGDTILDVGCAGGRDSKFFADSGLVVTGVDLSDVFISQARKAVPSATFINSNLLDLDFPENSFHGIWAQAVLLHLKRPDVPKALNKFYKFFRNRTAYCMFVLNKVTAKLM